MNIKDMDRSLCFVLAMYRKLKEMALISNLYKKELDAAKEAYDKLLAVQEVEQAEMFGLRLQIGDLAGKVALLQPSLDTSRVEVQNWIGECRNAQVVVERAQKEYNNLVDLVESGDTYVLVDDLLELERKYKTLKRSVESGCTSSCGKYCCRC